ncbi:BCCT family transporter [Corynebacterium kalidii]|uniref:BCCT family transporter n=1 Tax=Corynebacterium kalidii TaxID=2931982 RepID=A0A9X1WHU5_9CORY|nr:BCCT family transporter [Corynebacterium kalidii]MCJ7857857.1 BCCT family transporter [Corynebacterium kalidii]
MNDKPDNTEHPGGHRRRGRNRPSINPVDKLRTSRTQGTVGLYPHDLHPGLVPGISVEEQRNRFGLDRTVFGVAAVLMVSFITWGIVSPATVGDVASTVFAWSLEHFGWLLNSTMMLGVIVMAYLAFSRFGKIKLGKDDEKPEFSRFSWVAMMFGAGIGVGIFFFGPSEPLSHYLSPPPETVEGETPAALHRAMAQSHFHWGLFIWGLYAMVGGALAYSSYRRGRVTLISSLFRSLFGQRQTEGLAGRLVDIMAIIATLFGTAATLGLSAIQIGQGVEIISGVGEVTNTVLIAVVGVLSLGFIISAVSGVARGIRYLSNINVTLTLGLVLFVFLLGPTLFLLNLIPAGILNYADNMLDMMSRGLSWGDETIEFQAMWTAFYWAWWIAWTPFVGTFIARISRGRTIRELAIVTTLAPTFILILAFTVFGGTAISFNREGREGFDGSASPQNVLFSLFNELPLGAITGILLMVVLAIFFITSADSASTVMGTLSERGNPRPRKVIVVFWGLCMTGIAVVMLLSGGETALTGLQSLTYLVAIPFSLVLVGIAVSFIKDLSTDPAAIRRTYAQNVIQNAVIKGLEEHGDDFELEVSAASDGRGAGADFDSTDEKVTGWYRRTDEDGNEITYDYASGEWADSDSADDPADDPGDGRGDTRTP